MDRFITPSATPYPATSRRSAGSRPASEGRQRASSIGIASAFRSSTAPANPTRSNSDTATAAPLCTETTASRTSTTAGAALPLLSAETIDLAADLVLGYRPAAVDVPGVCRNADSPAHDRKDRPEEAAVGDRPDDHQHRVDRDVDEQMGAEVALLLQALDRLVAKLILGVTGTLHCRCSSNRLADRAARPGRPTGELNRRPAAPSAVR